MSLLGVKNVSQQSLLFVEGRGRQEEPSESTQFQELPEAVACILNFLGFQELPAGWNVLFPRKLIKNRCTGPSYKML